MFDIESHGVSITFFKEEISSESRLFTSSILSEFYCGETLEFNLLTRFVGSY